MKKRIMSLVMAWLLTVLAGVPAFAGTSYKTIFKAKTKLPEVTVRVLGTGNVYLNPLKLPVSIGYDEEDTDTYGQVISVPQAIQNESIIPVTVSVTVTGAVKSGSSMSLSDVSLSGSTTTSKKAFLYFEMQEVSANVDWENNDKIWDGYYNSGLHQVVSTTSKTKSNIAELSAADSEGANGGIGAFHLAGDTVSNPSTAWTKSDGVTVTVAFTFTPEEYGTSA